MDVYQIFGSIFIAAITGYITFCIQAHRLKQEMKIEFMAEKVAKELLSSKEWTKRDFTEIKKRLGGFSDDELRKILVRAGAVRFEKRYGAELWGLLSRNKNDL